jgi:hypothetical protein
VSPNDHTERRFDGIPWLAVDPSGRIDCVVYAANALDAMRVIPPGTSLYVGGPCPEHPRRPWWTENWPNARVGQGSGRGSPLVAASAGS